LTKIQAILLPIPVALWACLALRRRALGFVPVWGLVGVIVLFLGWPFLWSDPVAHFQQYLGRTTNRSAILVWYGGEAIADRDVPWHYPWILWGTTVPLGLHLLGAAGVWQSLRPCSERLWALLPLACLVFPLVLFTIPGIAVYDGERLFSVSYSLWGVFVGVGSDGLRRWLALRVSSRLAAGSVAVLLAAQSYGLMAMAPCWLSYYNVTVGGLKGAERLGLPVSYWGDGVTRELLETTAAAAPRGAKIACAPVLHERQWNEVLGQCPALREREVQFVPLGSPAAAGCDLLLMFSRREYLPPEYRGTIDPQRVVASIVREGVVLAVLVRLR